MKTSQVPHTLMAYLRHELGAEDYLQKPCDPILLQARIATSLEKKRLGNLTILRESDSANENRTAKSNRIYTYRSKIDA